MKVIKLKVSRCIFLQPKNERVFHVIQLGNVEPGDHSSWMRRWREVKLRAFSAADHRTIRDLKG
ncbi:hypothetical protein DEO72_LG11g3 [Vigna unguiculata]|uniref:Uncharacterized protein n=1 Tax=Vigna unguiculata TaxID=3917 RepID=A0A4D6NJ39_VIGUN|nr:hypothetical protein DEO72_LG11g3 [Vigna unguiculata]